MASKAIAMIRGLTAEPEIGAIYRGVVARTVDFGAFVTILPNLDGLVHISELSDERVEKTTDVCHEGDEMIVKCIGLERGGKIKLSRKEALGQKPTISALE
jgi:polyribonucleotide nucleotidyltransferase